MSLSVEKRLALVWLILSAATVASLSVMVTDGRGALSANAVVTVSAIVVSLIKVRLILMEFMELHHGRRLLRYLADVWLLVTAAALFITYFVGMASVTA